MGRILAIDYGSKRTGIAVTDEMQIIASGLTSVSTKNLIEFLKSYTSSEKVDLIVIGLPKQMNNELSESEPLILKFIKILNNQLLLILVENDEKYNFIKAEGMLNSEREKIIDLTNKTTNQEE